MSFFLLFHSIQNYSPKASYVTLQKKLDNKLDIIFHKVDYDVHSAVNAAKAQGREDWAHFLSTGRTS